MKATLLLFAVLLLVPQGEAGHFSKEGLAFDYPAGWTVADSSDAQSQRLTLRREGTSNIILVFAQREPLTTPEQFSATYSGVTLPYITNIAHKLGLNRPPLPSEAQCVPVGGRTATGLRMSGQLEGRPTTAEVYTVVLAQRMLHLVHVRDDKDEAAGAPAWKALLDTLKVEGSEPTAPEADSQRTIVSGGVLNAKAIKKPQPRYPPEAKSARAQGTVAVQIVVGENGEVVSAVAVSGHPLLKPAGVEAARKAKFEPVKICGQPVRVSGVITYNFVLL